MKNSAFRRSLVVPAVLLIGFGGTALAAAPAFADPAPTVTPAATSTATPTPTASSTTTPVTSATAAPGVVAAPSATSTSTPTPTVSATPTPTVSATPAPAATAKAPTGLTLTSPVPDGDDLVTIHGARVLTLTGTAPTGSVIALYDDYDGDRIVAFRTTSTTFTFSHTFATDDPYDQFIDVIATHSAKTIGETSFEVLFDAPTSATPTLDAPATGSTYTKGLLPFGLSFLAKPVTFSGTGTPGDDVTLEFDGTAQQDSLALDIYHGGGLQGDDIVVDDDGTWTGSGYLFYGTTTVSASQVQLGGQDSDEPVTVDSDSTAPITITTNLPAGTILPPVVTKPAYPSLDQLGLNVSSGAGASASASISSAALGSKAALRYLEPNAATASNPVTAGAEKAARIRATLQGKAVPAASAAASTDSDENEAVVEGGIQVAGAPSQDAPGFLTTTVSGTGTPGDGIVLWFETPSGALPYYEKLYPTLFNTLLGTGNAADATTLSDDPGTVTSLLPTDDHSITVGANGTWSTTVTLKPGPYYLAAFQTDPASAAKPTYSVAGALTPINLTGKPLVVPADDGTQLAFTGSNSGPTVGIALAAIIAGGGLLFVARRRRQV